MVIVMPSQPDKAAAAKHFAVKRSESECFSSLRSVESMTDWWWLCMTHGGKEKALARKLAAARVDYFLPLTHIREIREHPRGAYRVNKIRPLFPSYIFLNGDESRDAASYAAEKLVIYPVSSKTQILLTRELVQISKAMEVNPSLGTQPHNFKDHDRVRVIKGPMMGVTGNFDRKSEDYGRIWLEVKLLGQTGVPLEVPIEFCESAE